MLQRLTKKTRGIYYGWRIVVISAVSRFLQGGLYSNGLAVYFLPVSRDLGVSRTSLSFVFALRSLESGFDGPLMGYLVDRFGPRFMVRIGVVLAGLGFILLYFTNSYFTFLLVFIGVLALGFSAGFTHPFMAVINQWFSRRRALAMNLIHVGTEIGGALLTPLIALVVLNVWWREAALLSGVLILAVVSPLALLIRNSPESMGLSPNPPKDTDGRREDSGRGWVRELQGRWPGVLG